MINKQAQINMIQFIKYIRYVTQGEWNVHTAAEAID